MHAADTILARILAYARERWCWDDESFLEEQYELRWRESDTPEAFVDALAEDFELLDPRDYLLKGPP